MTLTPYSPVRTPTPARPVRQEEPPPDAPPSDDPAQVCPLCGGPKWPDYAACRTCRPSKPVVVTFSPGTATVLGMCERRGVPLAIPDGTGGLRLLRTAADL